MWTRPAGLLSLALALTLGVGCIPDDPPPTSAATGKPAPMPSNGTAAKPADAAAKPADADATDTKALLATVDALKGRLRERPRDFGVNIALGNLFYENGRYIEAIEYYTDALKLGADAETKLLAFAKDAKPAAKVVPDSCQAGTSDGAPAIHGEKGRSFEAIEKAALAEAPADGPDAVACWRQLLPMLAEAHAREGNAWYLVGNGDKARESHDKALALDPDQPEALFFKGAHLLESAHGDPQLLAQGRAVWEHLLKVAPNHPRSQIVRETLPRIDELFGKKAEVASADGANGLPAGHPNIGGGDAMGGAPMAQDAMAAAPALAPGMMAAMQNVKHTPELDKQLDDTLVKGEALLGQSKWQDALDTFKQVMPLRPDGHVALDMGIALRELGKPTAERVLTMAAGMPGGDPSRARLELGMFYEKSDAERAKALFQQLADDPKVGAQAKAELAKL